MYIYVHIMLIFYKYLVLIVAFHYKIYIFE